MYRSLDKLNSFIPLYLILYFLYQICLYLYVCDPIKFNIQFILLDMIAL